MKLAEENKNKGVTFAAISCTTYRSVCSINHVRGYPSILAFNIPTTAPGLYIITYITCVYMYTSFQFSTYIALYNIYNHHFLTIHTYMI